MLNRHGVYYFRKAVPLPLPSIIGKREILVSLKTKDREVAKSRLHRAALEADALLAAAKKKLAAQTPQVLADRWKADLLHEDAEARSLLQPKTKAEVDQEIADLEGALAEVRSYLTYGDIAGIQDGFLAVMERYGAKLAPESSEFRQAAHALMRAGVEALHVLQRRSRGDWSDVQAPLVVPASQDLAQNPPLSLVLDTWLSERKPPSKTAHEVRATFARFKVACGGDDRPIREVSKADVRSFRTLLLGESAKVGKGKGSLAPATVRKYLNLLGTVFSWAVKTGLIDANPVAGMAFVATGKREEREPKRQPFSEAQLRTLFASPLHTGAESKARRGQPGNYVEQDALWWVFPMTLYSGMRIEEAMGLRIEDMREVDGVLSFVVESRPERTLKTASSARVVPVHKALIRLGLVEWRDKQLRGGLLFPELRPDKRHGKLTAALSKTAGRYLRALKMPVTITTYSTRHAFADGLRRAKVEPEIRSRLLGHSTQTMTERYGIGHDMKALRDAVNAVSYEGIGQ
jgi:integrase